MIPVPIFIDGRARRLRLARALLAGYGTTDDDDEQNAELALRTAERCDASRDDVLTNASNYRLFIETTGGPYSKEFLSRFCFVVELLRRNPRPTRH